MPSDVKLIETVTKKKSQIIFLEAAKLSVKVNARRARGREEI